jgi:transcriptional antiterminator NusG
MAETNNMELSEEKIEENAEFAEDVAEDKGPKANWYVVHTYSGYENKVKANIEKTIENRHLENEILEVRVPMQDVTEVKNGV